MKPWRTIWSKLRSFAQSREVKGEIDDELRLHLEMRTAENIAAGMSQEEAARAARRHFGNVQSVREECRDICGASFGETTLKDIRFGLRMLCKNPGFTAVAVLTLALGTGATTALFSVIYGVLISPYPYARPSEIWTPGLRSPNANQRMRPYRLSEYLEMARLPAFSDVMATGPGSVLLTGEFAPESIRGVRVSGNAFQFLGVPPLFDRTIQPSDIRSTGEPELVTVLSFRRAQKLIGRDDNTLG